MNPAYKIAAAALAALAVGAPAAASADCKLLQLAEFHVDPHRRSPIVEGTINRKPVKVLFDTGSFTMMPASEALRLGMVLQPLITKAYGVGGQSDVYSTQIRELKLGGFTKDDLALLVAGDRSGHTDVSLVLGDDFFSQVDTEFDLPHNAVRLFQPQGCAPPQLVYWGAAAYSQAPLLPWRRENPTAASEAFVNGHRVLAEFDTGSFDSLIDRATASSLSGRPAEAPDAREVHGFKSRGEASEIADFDSFALGDEKVGHVRLRVLDLLGDLGHDVTDTRIPVRAGDEDAAAMLIGADFFHAHRVFFDVQDRLVLFTYQGGPVFTPEDTQAASTK